MRRHHEIPAQEEKLQEHKADACEPEQKDDAGKRGKGI